MFTGHPEIISITNFHGVSQIGDDCISKVRVAMLEDYDVTSCYDVINTADTFVLDRKASVEDPANLGTQGITLVNISTFDMPCGDNFHISMYQKGQIVAKCGPISKHRVHCAVLTQIEFKDKYTQCTYECSCQHNDCQDPDVIYLSVRNPEEGGLCDITMLPL